MNSMKNIQKRVDEWFRQYKINYWQPLEMLARLTEENGELAREINYRYGPKKKKATEEPQNLGDEMADIIFSIVCLANSLDIDLDKHFDRVMDKCYGRDKDRWKNNT